MAFYPSLISEYSEPWRLSAELCREDIESEHHFIINSACDASPKCYIKRNYELFAARMPHKKSDFSLLMHADTAMEKI